MKKKMMKQPLISNKISRPVPSQGAVACVKMRFIYMDDLSQVEKGYAGIPEPVSDEPVANDTTALVLMPGLAFDSSGHRIGYGGGFYDRFFASEPEHFVLALCFDFQIVDSLPVEPHDRLIDAVLTEEE